MKGSVPFAECIPRQIHYPYVALERRARYKRRYQAAWILLLGKYTYFRLTPEQQAAVRERKVAYLTSSGVATARIINRLPNRFLIEYVRHEEPWDSPCSRRRTVTHSG